MLLQIFVIMFGCMFCELSMPSQQDKVLMHQEELCDAVAFNNAPRVAVLLSTKKNMLDVNACGRDDLTPLYLAVTLGNKKIVALLLQAGAIIDESPDNKNICMLAWSNLKTVIGEQIRSDYEEIASLLLYYKASYKICHDLTPYKAMKYNYYRFARDLVYAGLWNPVKYYKMHEVTEWGAQFLLCMKQFVEGSTVVFDDTNPFLTWCDYMKTACGAQKVIPALSLLHARFYTFLLKDYHEIVAWAKVCKNTFVLDILTGFTFKNRLFEYQKNGKSCDLICITTK